MARRKTLVRPRKRSAGPTVFFQRRFSAVPQAAERTLQDVLRALSDGHCRCGDLDEIRLALREALNNALRHGCQLDPRKRVELTCRCDPRRGLEITVRDEGGGFDPSAIPDPTTPEGLERFSGRGLYMIRQMMDRVEFSNGGRQIRLHRAPRAEEAAGD